MSAAQRLFLVTGLSGSGRTSVLKGLEDMGVEAIDNLPLRLLEPLIDGDDGRGAALAVALDMRTRGFDPLEIGALLERLRARDGLVITLIFLECEDEVLLRRFTETRRRHPMADGRPLGEALAAERRHLATLRERADEVIDTTALTGWDLRQLLMQRFAEAVTEDLMITVESFSFRRGLPRAADLVFDVRFLRNPHYVAELRQHPGSDPKVAAFVRGDDGYMPFMDRLIELVDGLIPRYRAEGKSYLTVAVGCTGGRHRSVCVAGDLTRALTEEGHHVTLRHRDVGDIAHAQPLADRTAPGTVAADGSDASQTKDEDGS